MTVLPQIYGILLRPSGLKIELHMWISFLLLLKQMISNLVASDNTNLLSYNSEGQILKTSFTGLKLSVSRAVFLLKIPGEKLPCFFQLLEVAYIS